MSQSFAIDGFRYIGNLHTTVRCLEIISGMAANLGTRDLPMPLLNTTMLNWSKELEKQSAEYLSRKGKLTEQGKATTAFNHYVALSKELGIIESLNSVVRLTRLGRVLFLLTRTKPDSQFSLTLEERLFYYMILIQGDADAIFTLLAILSMAQLESTQSAIQKQYVTYFKERLSEKQKVADTRTALLLRDKLKDVQFRWKNPEKYAEHIVAPRLQWLCDLGLLSINKSARSSIYYLTQFGHQFLQFSFTPTGSIINDVNNDWIEAKLFHSACKALGLPFDLMWRDLDNDHRLASIGGFLSKAMHVFGVESSKRISFHTLYLFVAVSMFVNRQIVFEKEEFRSFLKARPQIGDRVLGIHSAARANEEYMTFS